MNKDALPQILRYTVKYVKHGRNSLLFSMQPTSKAFPINYSNKNCKLSTRDKKIIFE